MDIKVQRCENVREQKILRVSPALSLILPAYNKQPVAHNFTNHS